MKTPLVSVVIPTYNRAETLRRSIDSALEQSYSPLEVIVVDDGSSDGTREVLRGYGERIRIIHQENSGPSSARNHGADAARGELLAFLDSDDVWKPAKIAHQVRMMLEGGEAVPCCMCNATLVDGESPVKTSFEISDVMSPLAVGFWLNPAPILATRFILFNQVAMIRRSAFEKTGGFKPGMRLLEDYDLAFRLALLGPWAFLTDPLVEKHNDTNGIGVIAMRAPLMHSRAWQGVLTGFLRETDDRQSQVRRLVERALRDVAAEIRMVEWSHGALLDRTLAKAGLFLRRKHHALRRRMPGWPRVQAVAELTDHHSSRVGKHFWGSLSMDAERQ